MRRLFLLRHGKSAWPDGVPDHARPLAPRGEAAVPLVARRLAAIAGRIDLVLVSDSRRTRETFARLEGSFPGLAMHLEPRIYEARPSVLIDVIRTLPDQAEQVLMIGHNPGMQAVALHLAEPGRSDADALARLERKFPTAGLAVLECEDEWAATDRDCARLSAFITPAMLGGTDED
jgi:phosphohistidine phosphatase